MRRRTRAREIALQFLYMADLRDDAEEGLAEFLKRESRDRQVREFALRDIEGTIVACGMGVNIWTPPRCPPQFECLESEGVHYRICCNAALSWHKTLTFS